MDLIIIRWLEGYKGDNWWVGREEYDELDFDQTKKWLFKREIGEIWRGKKEKSTC